MKYFPRFLVLNAITLPFYYIVNFFSDNGTFLLLELITLTSILYGILILFSEPSSRINFFLVAALTIMMGSSLGILNSYFYLDYIYEGEWDNMLMSNGITITEVIESQCVANTFSMVLSVISLFLQQSKILKSIHLSITKLFDNEPKVIFIFITIIVLSQFYAILTNLVAFGGRLLEEQDKATHPLIAIIGPIVPCVVIASSYYHRHSFKKKSAVEIVFFTGILLLELYWHFLTGRRTIIFCTLLILLGYGFNEIITLRTLRKTGIYILIFCYISIRMTDIFYIVRAFSGYENIQKQGILDVIQNLSVDESTRSYYRNINIATRSSYSSVSVASFLKLFKDTNNDYLQGVSILNSLMFATPSNFFYDKKEILLKEDLYSNSYRLSLDDISETIYLESIIDFGFLGLLFVYPFILFVSSWPFYWYCSHSRNELNNFLLVGTYVYLAFSMIETDTLTFLISIRSLIVSFFVSFVIYVLFKRKELLNINNK